MKAIILAGGFGTRLKSVLANTPKPMAPIGDKPFLARLLDYLQQQGVADVILSLHYLKEQFQNYFGAVYAGMPIQYVIEEAPLGTGGAIAHALTSAQIDEPCFVLNGDTFVKLDYQAMFEQHLQSTADVTMALRTVDDCSRYGSVIVQGDNITAFREKGIADKGLINAGVYLIQPDLFERFSLPTQFSFEVDFVQKYVNDLDLQAFYANNYFIDIGVPEDYQRAIETLS